MIVPELSPTSTSLDVPLNVMVPPRAVAVELEPSETVIDELLSNELPMLPASLEAAIEPASMALVTLPVSPVPTKLPVLVGSVRVTLPLYAECAADCTLV